MGTGSHRGPRVGGRWLCGECNGGRYPLTGGGVSTRLEFEAGGLELKRVMSFEWAVSSAAVAAWVVRALGFSARALAFFAAVETSSSAMEASSPWATCAKPWRR